MCPCTASLNIIIYHITMHFLAFGLLFALGTWKGGLNLQSAFLPSPPTRCITVQCNLVCLKILLFTQSLLFSRPVRDMFTLQTVFSTRHRQKNTIPGENNQVIFFDIASAYQTQLWKEKEVKALEVGHDTWLTETGYVLLFCEVGTRALSSSSCKGFAGPQRTSF